MVTTTPWHMPLRVPWYNLSDTEGGISYSMPSRLIEEAPWGSQLVLLRWLNAVLSAQLIGAALVCSQFLCRVTTFHFLVQYLSCIFISVYRILPLLVSNKPT